MLVVLSAPTMFGFMRGQPSKMRELGYKVGVIAAPSAWLDRACGEEKCERHVLDIGRDISAFSDTRALASLCRIFMKQRPSAVILSGPKALFLGSIAAFLVDVPTRLLVYHGMRQETAGWPLRNLLNLCDRISFAAATAVLAVSPSLAKRIKDERLDMYNRARSTKPGTAGGVDIVKLGADQLPCENESANVRARLGLPITGPILLYLGRLCEDKGLHDLPIIAESLARSHPDATLVLVGADESRSVTDKSAMSRLSAQGNVILRAHSERPAEYIIAADLLVLPTRREGFGMAFVECGAFGKPAVGYDVTGARDAVISGKTGMLVPTGDVQALIGATRAYLDDESLRRRHGMAAVDHARSFSPEKVWKSYEDELLR